MSYLGVLIVNNIPCWDFPSPIKGCLIKVYSLKGQIDCLSEFDFWGNGERSLDFCPPLLSSRHPQTKIRHFHSKRTVYGAFLYHSKLEILRSHYGVIFEFPSLTAIGYVNGWFWRLEEEALKLKIHRRSKMTFDSAFSTSFRAWNIEVPLWSVFLNFLLLRQFGMSVDGFEDLRWKPLS